MTARLDISEDSRTGRYVIGWWDEEAEIEGDFLLGHKAQIYSGDDEECIKEANEHNYVSDKIKEQCPPYAFDGSGGFMWESKTKAIAALRRSRALLKQFRSDRPWPEWALKATEAGWKPPRGWKP